MTTRFIGTKELRQNMAKITRESARKNERLIVLRKNKPIFELRPLNKADALMESLRIDVEEARTDIKSGNVYNQKEIEKKLGL